jgi:hypothetical protein
VKVIKIALKLGPIFIILFFGLRGSPGAEDVVNVPLVVDEVRMAAEHVIFMDGVENSGVVAGWWSAHGGTRLLMPESIAKGEHIVVHDDVQGLHHRIEGQIFT